MTQKEIAPICHLRDRHLEELGKLRGEGSDKMTQRAAAALIMWTECHPRVSR